MHPAHQRLVPIRKSTANAASILLAFILAISQVSCLMGCLMGCLMDSHHAVEDPYFPRTTAGLPDASPVIEKSLRNGDTLDFTAAPVKKVIDGKEVRMIAFNGSVPGPVLRVRQGDSIILILHNRVGFPITLHPHGIRGDPHDDGAAGFSQDPIPDGGQFIYHLVFPDVGAFWYHSHVREDAFNILGLYGSILVAPKDTAYWNPVHLEVPLMIGEVPMDSSGIAPIRKDMADHVLMGRFGNVFLANGDTDYTITVKRNSFVRFYVTNACNTRVLNLGLSRINMKVVGSDNGRYETSYLSGGEILAPGERLIFEAGFEEAGTFPLVHIMPNQAVSLMKVIVQDDSVSRDYYDTYYANMDKDSSVTADIESFRPSFHKDPDKRILLTGKMDGMMMMKPAATAEAAGAAHAPDGSIGIEWVDTMGTMNSASTMDNTTWIIRDMETGLENHDIYWHFKKGDQVLIRIKNDSNALHPMPHPIHFHGQRFLVTAVDGKENLQLAWKDTYLVPTGSTADILLDASNPGAWMAHCHIAEHAEDHMMFYFRVD
jgi:FtsP/CotA-like multicopper oxidase with cupredoxin domain